jgi:hypothetical protein
MNVFDLERELAGRLPGPTAEFRQRVLAAVRRELSPNDFWRFAALVAAAALLAINLSMSVANHASWNSGSHTDLGPLPADSDGARQELLVRAQSRLIPIADLRHTQARSLEREEP